jgi:hypothetical protein
MRPFDGAGECGLRCASAAQRADHDSSRENVLAVVPNWDRPVAQNWEQSYGHIWSSIDAFFTCIVQERLACRQSTGSSGVASRDSCPGPLAAAGNLTVLVPAQYSAPQYGQVFPIFRELQHLFSGPGSGAHMQIVRTPSVPACAGSIPSDQHGTKRPRADMCCADGLMAAGGRDRGVHAVQLQLHRGGVHTIPSWSWREPPLSSVEHARAMRSVVWANVGIPSGGVHVDTVTFVSTRRSSNGRRIAEEASLVRALKRFVAHRRPTWRFVHAELESLGSYAEEVALMARTRLLIGLFGSALHNCRFLPQDSVVIELHGALKNDVGFRDWYLYYKVCQRQVGIRWVGVPADNAMNNVISETHGSSDEPSYLQARFNTTKVVEAVNNVIDGQWEAVAREYVRAEQRATRLMSIHPALGPTMDLPKWLVRDRRTRESKTRVNASEEAHYADLRVRHLLDTPGASSSSRRDDLDF